MVGGRPGWGLLSHGVPAWAVGLLTPGLLGKCDFLGICKIYSPNFTFRYHL